MSATPHAIFHRRDGGATLLDGRVHHCVLSTIAQRGYPPSVDEIASSLGTARDAVERSLRSLQEGHGLVLHPGSLDVWIAHPFSTSPTPVWVAAGPRGFW